MWRLVEGLQKAAVLVLGAGQLKHHLMAVLNRVLNMLGERARCECIVSAAAQVERHRKIQHL